MQANQQAESSTGTNRFSDADEVVIEDTLTQVPDKESGPWRDYDKVAHVEHKGIGRHATTIELAEGKESWIKGERPKIDRTWTFEEVRHYWHQNIGSSIEVILTRMEPSRINRPYSEIPQGLKKSAIVKVVNETQQIIRRAVVMGLGTIFEAEPGKFKQAIRAHLLARYVIVALVERARLGNGLKDRPFEIIFEDCHYSEDDMKFLQKEFIVDNDPLVNVIVSNDGSGWDGTRVRQGAPDENAYAFITFGLDTPLRQVLAGHTWGERSPYTPPPAPNRPSLVICRPWDREYRFDQSDSRVQEWMGAYYATGEDFLKGGVEGVWNELPYVLQTSH